MKTGSAGTFVISWSQTETDGVVEASPDMLTVGVPWRWTGVPVRLDGPAGILRLDGSEAVAQLRRSASPMARRLVGHAAKPKAGPPLDPGPDPTDASFTLTDGYRAYPMTLVALPANGALLAIAEEGLPPKDQDLWVSHATLDRSQIAQRPAGGVICFTPDTLILTPQGPRPVQNLSPGNLVLTRDNGAQAVLWTGQRLFSATRLYLMPHLRPIRLLSHALGRGRPDPALLVSPQHRMLVRGRAAQALFNVDEVLVKAEDMVNDRTITVDHRRRDVTYVHILLERHSVIWANGLESESFHPTHAAQGSIDPAQHAGLRAVLPSLDRNPHAYGDFARRTLNSFEAAVLRHDSPGQDMVGRGC